MVREMGWRRHGLIRNSEKHKAEMRWAMGLIEDVCSGTSLAKVAWAIGDGSALVKKVTARKGRRSMLYDQSVDWKIGILVGY